MPPVPRATAVSPRVGGRLSAEVPRFFSFSCSQLSVLRAAIACPKLDSDPGDRRRDLDKTVSANGTILTTGLTLAAKRNRMARHQPAGGCPVAGGQGPIWRCVAPLGDWTPSLHVVQRRAACSRPGSWSLFRVCPSAWPPARWSAIAPREWTRPWATGMPRFVSRMRQSSSGSSGTASER